MTEGRQERRSARSHVQSTLQQRSQPANAEQRAKEKELLIPLDVSWDWEKLDGSGRIRVTIHIPDLIASSITSQETFLDIEPRRILVTLLSAGGETRTVDINRNLSDAELAVKAKDRARLKVERIKGTGLSLSSGGASLEELEEEILAESEKEVEKMLRLKRVREFDVDGANAQWIVKDKKLVITL
ncbi:hypothetical protein NMY22_g20063 [Coprinellus aureogranulatus]|nr:hypothetical protein NMY22_g20063 [Coprinellus aureogranulatus]